ncbi:MAG: hypothetical protein GC159_16190 [Phycisphaera sp.]|nr:hypothetical protein [Phycisphaera sp.]
MRILITGIGDAFTTEHFSTGALLKGPDGYVMIDCPDLPHRVLRTACDKAGIPQVDASMVGDIILTHLHGDHSNGLESFGFLRRVWQLEGRDLPRPRLHTAAPIAERVWERLAPAMDAPMGHDRPSRLDDYFDVHIIEPGESASIAGMELRCRFTRHTIPTIGLLIRDGDATLGWASDTPFDPEHIEWLSEADVIIHEANFSVAHTPIGKLNALPDDLRRRIRLIHLPDGFEPACTDLSPVFEGEIIDL